MKKGLAILLILLLVCSGSLAEDAVTSATLKIDMLPAVEAADNGILVVYFSPGDTVRAAAYILAAALSADLFEIVPEEPYTTDDLNYYDRNARSMVETGDSTARPAIAELPEDLSRYDTILLGYPIWGGQAPKILYTFLENTDLSGKTIIPFCTSNSSGIGSSDTNLHALTDDSVLWQKGTRIKKGSTAEEITLLAQTLITE
ncbi:MAG: flavodoxin [Oscillospiraceae bacterium]|nr:flavodoxin [Oscillospiraceae bacterium]